MSTNFPTSLDSPTNPVGTDLVNNANSALKHDAQHANANDAIKALETKVGVDSSAVTTTLDYKLSGVTGTDKAASKAGSETLTNKTIVGANNSVSGITEAMQTLANNTTGNVSTSAHGYAPIAPNDTKKFLRGDAAWAVPTLLVNIGTVNHDVSSNTTDTVAHGLGVTPKLVKITVILAANSGSATIGFVTYIAGQNAVKMGVDVGTGTSTVSGIDGHVYSNITSPIGTSVGLTAPDATNIFITWSKDATSTGTAYVLWEAYA